MIRLRAGFVVTVSILFASASSSVAQDAATCLSKQLKASGKACGTLAKCEAAAKKTAGLDPTDCISAAGTKLAASLAKIESKGGCTVQDAVTHNVQAILASAAADAASALPVAGSNKCAAGKLGALGKRCAASFKCNAAAAAASTNVDSTCIQKVTDKFDGAFAKVDAGDDCSTSSDSAALIPHVDDAVNDTFDYLSAIECRFATDCAGTDTECQQRVCTSNTCGLLNAGAGTLLATQTPGDCRQQVCDGAGGVTLIADDTDVPASTECAAQSCNGGNLVTTNLGGTCNASYGICDSGSCLVCTASPTCTDPLAPCYHWALCMDICSALPDADGTPTSDTTPGDCMAPVCDGNGGTRLVPDPTDGVCP